MAWQILLHPDFVSEHDALAEEVQDELSALLLLLSEFGPVLKRPGSDTLANSKHANMKELRFNASVGVWRVAYAFDPERKAILLVAGDKSGVSQKRFYRQLISKADARFDQHLVYLNAKEKKNER